MRKTAILIAFLSSNAFAVDLAPLSIFGGQSIDDLLDKTYMASAHEYGVRPNKPQTFMAGFSLDF